MDSYTFWGDKLYYFKKKLIPADACDKKHK